METTIEMDKPMKYAVGILLAAACFTAVGSAANPNEDNEYGYVDQILATTHFQVDLETIVPLNKFYRVNASGKHTVCQQYVKLNHASSDHITVCEFCG